MIKKIDHIAIAVNDIEEAARLYVDTFLHPKGAEILLELVEPEG